MLIGNDTVTKTTSACKHKHMHPPPLEEAAALPWNSQPFPPTPIPYSSHAMNYDGSDNSSYNNNNKGKARKKNNDQSSLTFLFLNMSLFPSHRDHSRGAAQRR